MLVQSILKSKASAGVVTISPEAPVSDAAKLLAEKGIGTVVVSSDNETADGILSERDIVRELGKSGSGCLTCKVKDYMTSKLVTCTSESNVEDILQQMTEGRFRHMPVVEGGKMVGLISLGDVVKAKLAEVAMEKDALEGMIMGH
ncbi:CBS domain-containing protein [Phaeobacter gallaeciensis]|uniref:CBS domain-containing protein n=1 Tax=Phaeobacter gallaeciensis TaxID=60890 RepID=UPI00237F53DB|nr:CBS domain-containing protein [Phaeobacter gallaeciensis]MDE4096573.1 CBS domain-containing protein [Phaeobacter gallaeciensis]MDE4105384.1 CBS domain-containing protein [Phaeobacter gallaeciensis]MDE4109840.1 CBS domain-containing protein [Phaeobacter gallaeciensis]MDE4114308.1 CBS domain-containing protein [Phaeobacter gallaeciensis]MDE4118775.1 CBS domain-containing protein [Phaeobacter gallaeciensis]